MIRKSRWQKFALLGAAIISASGANLLTTVQADELPADASSNGELCILAPKPTNTADAVEVWSDRPLFLWQGGVGKIEVNLDDSTAIWSQTPAATDQQLIYGGEALQPGQSYTWTIFDQNLAVVRQIPFRLLSADQQQAIAADLAALEQQFTEAGAPAEEIILRRASYFAQRQLWADALREIFSIEAPSPAIEQYQQGVAARFCQASS
jgi:hypothetical protein